MKNLLRSIATAFAMFSRVPMPRVEWKPENRKDTLACFPLVGLLLGILLAGWYALAKWLSLDSVLFSLGIFLLPILYTGGIHLDGFCDTVDALSSRAEPERKREILKDPHLGAFAVIGVSTYLITYFALGTELVYDDQIIFLLFFVPVLSRSVAGYVSIASDAGGAGLLTAMRDAAAERPAKQVLGIWFCLASLAMLAVSPLAGLVVVLAAVACGWLVWRMAKRQFGGMSGDLAGFLVQVSELILLAFLVILQKVWWI
ncbi:MAG: adenosylcobinamide-GDP ribazoletransferase [Eubacteriales bacterium]|nr:adenosylcobinamide-GDP ribazoletransferase [Eubacteriales bacterium]